ncbi:divergent PAP2 family protein [Lysinibacillus xylanilyticus]|uniref:divergent PAP2 family protein n=1 Tax=Lysinibacillus xylanilyticus TaxID=582475 RepID=UPI002B23F6F7|nr:divergent PAP2 family protein [Lysinibacillus xylanilyticus]MEB2281480.1 divergent PAP2 family protein [Lysinibacillus xylanilyticus]
MIMSLLQNTPLLVALFAVLFAQFVKIPIHFFMTGKINWGLFTSTGGMPSSHSASVTGLTTSIAYETGLDSPIFAVAAMFSFIVMYDASGVRFQAGQHAAVLNQLRKDFQTLLHDLKKWPQMDGQEKMEELKTLLGHKRSEVFFGALTGIFIAIITYQFIL